jgi:hypothetical protein
MEELWKARQEKLKRAHEGLTDLPRMLRERIIMIEGYLDGVKGGLRRILEGRRGRPNIGGGGGGSGGDNDEEDNNRSEKDDNVVRDVVNALATSSTSCRTLTWSGTSTPWADSPSSLPYWATMMSAPTQFWRTRRTRQCCSTKYSPRWQWPLARG